MNAHQGSLGPGWHYVEIGTVEGWSGQYWFYINGDPTPQISWINPGVWQAGTSFSITVAGTGFGWWPSLHINGVGISWNVTGWHDDGPGSSWLTANVSVASWAPTHPVQVYVISNGYWGGWFQPTAPGQQPQSNTATTQVNGVTIQLSCPSQVTRGTEATCTLSGVNAGSVTGWQFLGTDEVTVSGPSGVLSWGGTMVQSGTVRATVTGGGMVEVGISVTPRGWSTQPASPQQVANGSLSVTLLVPPGPQQGYNALLGWSEPQLATDLDALQTIGTGPNTGYLYYPSASHPTATFWFRYIINPDLEDGGSEFSLHQCGTNGWISHGNLLAQTRRHEYDSMVQSHWAFYANAINNPTNNPLAYAEARVGQPGTNPTSFSQITATELANRRDQIYAAAGQEPFAVNYSESGQSLGNVNLGPNYANCN